jgi:TPR repeat protein
MFLRRLVAHCAVAILFLGVAQSGSAFGQTPRTLASSQQHQKCLFDEYYAGAMGGDSDDEESLAMLYLTGRGVPEDHGEYAKWSAKAADDGNYIAAAILISTSEDKNEAARLRVKLKDRLISSANNGDASAQYWLGIQYGVGDHLLDIPKSPELRLQWLAKAAEGGDFRAALSLMSLHRDKAKNTGAQDDAALAVTWTQKALAMLKAAAESGNVKAQLELAEQYHKGSFGTVDDEEALKWLTGAAPRSFRANVAAALIALIKTNPDRELALNRVQGNGCAEFALADAFKKGYFSESTGFFSIPKEVMPEQTRMLQASEWMSRAAADGDPDAQMYLMNDPKTTDQDAFVMLRHLAEQGNLKSQYDLAHALLSGVWWRGSHRFAIDKDEAEGMRWLEKAAAQTGDWARQAREDLQAIDNQKREEEAQVRKSEEYKRAVEEENRRIENGTWIPEAKIMDAAAQGDARSQALVASAFSDQEGHVSLHDNKDAAAKYHKQAVDWYRKAAEGGNAQAQRMVAEMYFQGKDVPSDLDAGIVWLKKAADQGDSRAEMELGAYYRGFFWGQEVPKHPDQAKYWYTRAAEHGNKEAQEIVQRGGWDFDSGGNTVQSSSAGNRPVPPGSTRIIAFIPSLTNTVGKVGYHFTSNLVADCPGWWDKHGEPHGNGHWGSDTQEFIGNLPPGLSWTQNFGIEGTPEQPGNWTVTIRFHGLYCTLDDEHGKKPVDIGSKNEWTLSLKIEGDAPRRVH